MLSFLKDSVYSNMAPLFIGHNLLIVSKEPKAKELLTILRANPQIMLLGMFCAPRNIEYKAVIRINPNPDLDVCSVQPRV